MAAYILAEIEIVNAEGYKEYTKVVPGTIAQYGGKFLHRGGGIDVLEGDWPQRRRVIIEFASKERALEWYNSPEYAKPLALRKANSNGRLLLLDGV